MNDNVNHPSHYSQGGMETIDVIQGAMTAEEFRGFLKGNIIKYVSRASYKGGNEDLKKAEWYLDKLIDDEQQTAAPVDGQYYEIDLGFGKKRTIYIKNENSF